MNRQQLFENIRKKGSFLCVGLDTDIKKIPEFLLKEDDPVFEFNKRIIDATAPYCIAYKPNMAFYESYGMLWFYTALNQEVEYVRCWSDYFVRNRYCRNDRGDQQIQAASIYCSHGHLAHTRYCCRNSSYEYS